VAVSRQAVGRDVVGRQLNPDPRLTFDDHHVPVILGIDGAAEHPGPEAAPGREVCGVEHDHLVIDAHRVVRMIAERKLRRLDERSGG